MIRIFPGTTHAFEDLEAEMRGSWARFTDVESFLGAGTGDGFRRAGAGTAMRDGGVGASTGTCGSG